MSEPRTVSLDFLLRRVAQARAAGDVERARPEWEACVVRATVRVRAVVAAYRTVHGDAVAAADRDAVVNDALERALRRMVHTLEHFNERSFLAAMAGCAENACKDHFRRVGAYERGLRGSLDEPAHEEGGGSRHDDALRREAERRAADDEHAFEVADRVARALAALENPHRRSAVQLKELGLEYEEIAAALSVSVSNAYQLVSRGRRDLKGLMER